MHPLTLNFHPLNPSRSYGYSSFLFGLDLVFVLTSLVVLVLVLTLALVESLLLAFLALFGSPSNAGPSFSSRNQFLFMNRCLISTLSVN